MIAISATAIFAFVICFATHLFAVDRMNARHAREIEKARLESWNAGHETGYDDGYDGGYDDGWEDAWKDLFRERKT